MSKHHKRYGFALHEAMMAVALSAALAVVIAQLLVMVNRQRRLVRQDSIAVQELGNLMETTVARSWDEVSTEGLASLELSAQCATHLPGASLSADVAEEKSGAKRILLRIRWEPGPECAPESTDLVGWRFVSEEEQP